MSAQERAGVTNYVVVSTRSDRVVTTMFQRRSRVGHVLRLTAVGDAGESCALVLLGTEREVNGSDFMFGHQQPHDGP